MRKVIADDGIVSGNFQWAVAGWDHLAKYYAYCYDHGLPSAFRFSEAMQADRLAATPMRTFTYHVSGGGPGVYRMILAGSFDHVVSVATDPHLPRAVAGSPNWLTGHGEQYRSSFFHVPEDTQQLHLMFLEVDRPSTRSYRLLTLTGQTLLSDTGESLFSQQTLDLAKEHPDLRGSVLRFEVTPGDNDLAFKLDAVLPKRPDMGGRIKHLALRLAMADTPDLATAVKNGAMTYHGVTYWTPWQVQLHQWLDSL